MRLFEFHKTREHQTVNNNKTIRKTFIFVLLNTNNHNLFKAQEAVLWSFISVWANFIKFFVQVMRMCSCSLILDVFVLTYFKY